VKPCSPGRSNRRTPWLPRGRIGHKQVGYLHPPAAVPLPSRPACPA
jgi:hypothetical protein